MFPKYQRKKCEPTLGHVTTSPAYKPRLQIEFLEPEIKTYLDRGEAWVGLTLGVTWI